MSLTGQEFKSKVAESLDTNTLNTASLKFYNLVPAKIEEAKFIPIEGYVPGTTPQENVISTHTLPDGRAFLALTDALNRKEVPTDLAVLEDGRTIAFLDFQKEGFIFTEIFNDQFTCQNIDQFIFDDVNLKVEDDETEYAKTIDFSGRLRMDTQLLAPFQKLLQLEEGLRCSGTIQILGQDVSGKITPISFTLKSPATFLLPIAQGVHLTSLVLEVQITNKLPAKEGKPVWTAQATLTGRLEIDRLLTSSPIELRCSITYDQGKLQAMAEKDQITGILGIPELTLQSVRAEFDPSQKELDLDLSGIFAPGQTFEFKGKVTDTYTGLIAITGDFSLTDLSQIYQSSFAENLNLPEYDITFEKTWLGLATADCTIAGNEIQEGFTVSGTTTIHGYRLPAVANLSSKGVSLHGDLASFSLEAVEIVDPKLDLKIYRSSQKKIADLSIRGKANIAQLTLDSTITFEKMQKDWNTVLYAKLAANNFKLSMVVPPVSGTFVESLTFSNLQFIYSFKEGEAHNAGAPLPVHKGLQLVGYLEDLPPLTALTGSPQEGLLLSAPVGTPGEIAILGPETRLNLGASVRCDPVKIFIDVSKENPALELAFGLAIAMPNQEQPLHFDMGLKLDSHRATGEGTMKGYWSDPLGIKGLKVGPENAVQMTIDYAQFSATGTPSEFGFVGSLAFGDTAAQMAMNITKDKKNFILAGSVTKVTPQDLVSFINMLTGINLPSANIPDFFEIHDMKLYCAPYGGRIGTITFEPGVSFSGDFMLLGFTASINAHFSDQGLLAQGEMDELQLGILSIRGADGGKAKFDLELTEAQQRIAVNGAINFLGMENDILIDLSRHGATFRFEQKFLNQLTFMIHGESLESLEDSSTDFKLTAEFENHINNFLKTTVTQKIEQAIESANLALEDAKKDLAEKEKIYKSEFDQAKQKLDQCQATAEQYRKQLIQKVEDERKKYQQMLESAKDDVKKAKESYDQALATAQEKISEAEKAFNSVMMDAQNKLSSAERDFEALKLTLQNNLNKANKSLESASNQAHKELDQAKSKVNSLKKKLDQLKQKYKNLKWYQKIFRADLEAEILALEATIGTANLTLSAAQTAVTGLTKSTEYLAVQSAQLALNQIGDTAIVTSLKLAQGTLKSVQVGTEYATLEAAKATLNTIQTVGEYTVWQEAQLTLEGLKKTGSIALTGAEGLLDQIAESTEYLALKSAEVALELVKEGTSAVAFRTAQTMLTVAQEGAETMGKVAEVIIEKAADLFNVKKIKLSGQLKSILAGSLFEAEIQVVVLGKESDFNLDFDVKDVGGFVEKLFNNVLDKAKQVIE